MAKKKKASASTVSVDDEEAPGERWWLEICEEIGGRYPFVVNDAMNALNHGQGEREFHRAYSARDSVDDRKELEGLILIWLEPYISREVGRRQREVGSDSPGRRGKYKVPPEKLLADVQEMHTRFPKLTFNAVCNRVALETKKLKSAKPVTRAADSIKWPDPRRKQS